MVGRRAPAHLQQSVRSWMTPHGEIEGLLPYLFRLARFIKYRLMGCGPSSRNVVGGCCVGFGQTVHMTRREPQASGYYISGADRFKDPLRKLAVKLHLVAHGPDCIIKAIDKEEWLLRIVDELDQVLHDTLYQTSSVDASVWERLVEYIAEDGHSATVLAADVLQSSRIGMCVIHC